MHIGDNDLAFHLYARKHNDNDNWFLSFIIAKIMPIVNHHVAILSPFSCPHIHLYYFTLETMKMKSCMCIKYNDKKIKPCHLKLHCCLLVICNKLLLPPQHHARSSLNMTKKDFKSIKYTHAYDCHAT